MKTKRTLNQCLEEAFRRLGFPSRWATEISRNNDRELPPLTARVMNQPTTLKPGQTEEGFIKALMEAMVRVNKLSPNELTVLENIVSKQLNDQIVKN